MSFPPDRSSPLITEDLPDMTRSWCLLSITGLAPLARLSGTDRTPSEASIIRQISPSSIIFLQPAMRASVLGCFSSLRPHCSYQRKGSVGTIPGRGERWAGLISPGLGRQNRRGQALGGRGHQLGGRVNPLLIPRYPQLFFHQTFNTIVCFL
jgi:hypothetical protein